MAASLKLPERSKKSREIRKPRFRGWRWRRRVKRRWGRSVNSTLLIQQGKVSGDDRCYPLLRGPLTVFHLRIEDACTDDRLGSKDSFAGHTCRGMVSPCAPEPHRVSVRTQTGAGQRQVSRRSSHWRRLQLRRTYILRARRRFAPHGPRFPPELDWGILESRRVSLDAREGEAWLRAGPPEGSRGGVDGEGDRFAQGAAALSRRRGHPSLTRYSTYLQFTLMLCLVGEKRGKNIIANCVEKCVYESKE